MDVTIEDCWKSLSKEDNGMSFTETSAMEIPTAGCVVKVKSILFTTEGDVSAMSETITFVPWVKIVDRMEEDIIVGRKLVAFQKF